MCSVRTVQISVTDSAKFVQINVMNSVKTRAEQRDGFSKIRADQRDGSTKIRADQRDGFSKIPADQGDKFGFYSRRRTCKCRVETGETKCANRRNRFLALTAVESDDDEEVNAIEDSARGSGDHGGLGSGQERFGRVERKVSRERSRRRR